MILEIELEVWTNSQNWWKTSLICWLRLNVSHNLSSYGKEFQNVPKAHTLQMHAFKKYGIWIS